MLESPHWMETKSGAVEMRFPLPLDGLSLVEVFW